MTSAATSYAAIILSGGASTRMGRTKALLHHAGETFLDRLIRVFASRASAIVVVTGAHDVEIRAALQGRADVQIVTNPAPERGQISSLQEGLRALDGNFQCVFFHSVDIPLIEPATIIALCDALEAAPPDAPLAIPRFEGKRGHPILMRNALIPEFLTLPPGSTARDVIHAHRAETVYVDVEDWGVTRDIDTPEEYAALLQEKPQGEPR